MFLRTMRKSKVVPSSALIPAGAVGFPRPGAQLPWQDLQQTKKPSRHGSTNQRVTMVDIEVMTIIEILTHLLAIICLDQML